MNRQYNRSFLLQRDASGHGIAEVLTQLNDQGSKHPVVLARKMFSCETRYGVTEKEGLAVGEACKHFLPYLPGHHFIISTDHKALTFLHDKEPANGRLE